MFVPIFIWGLVTFCSAQNNSEPTTEATTSVAPTTVPPKEDLDEMCYKNDRTDYIRFLKINETGERKKDSCQVECKRKAYGISRRIPMTNKASCGDDKQCLDGKCVNSTMIQDCNERANGRELIGMQHPNSGCKMTCVFNGTRSSNGNDTMNMEEGNSCPTMPYFFFYPMVCKNGICSFK